MTPQLRLVQSQRQTLAMTPQLMQAIKLLQMSNLELEAAVREEVDQNPFLSLSAGPGTRPTARRDPFAASTLDPLASVADKPTLADHCLSQVASLPLTDDERAAAHFLVRSLDENGRLEADVIDDCIAHLAVSRQTVMDTLDALHTLEPAGLFARSLDECLSLQLRATGRLTDVAKAVLANLPLLARRDVRRLADLAGADEAAVMAVAADIRTLDPRPGRAFDTAPLQAIEPDVIVQQRADGSFLVALDTSRLPKVLVDADYHAEIAAGGAGPALTFANQCIRSAHWLTRSLDQRARTIVKVASAIVTRQRAFFEGQDAHVRPLTLREIADDIGMHESTVSRVVSNKALSTSRGVFPFRAFFAVAIDTADGSVSADAVRAKIRQLVDGECEGSVRSDDEIVKSLKASGIVIARRTVAKYREAMNIPSSVERRRIARQRDISPALDAR
ncbi:MAG: RNA polymerase factor sigma-54 [Pseudomonadota bacterium]